MRNPRGLNTNERGRVRNKQHSQPSKDDKKKGSSFLQKLVYGAGVLILAIIGGFAGGELSNMNTDDPSSQIMMFTLFDKEPEYYTISLEPFLTNVEDRDRKGVIRLSLSLQVLGEGNNEFIQKREALVRDTILHVLSAETPSTIHAMDESGDLLVKEKIKQMLNNAFDDVVVTDVFITDLIIQ